MTTKQSLKISRLKEPLLTRRIVGHSMQPTLRPGRIVWATPYLRVKPGKVVIARHQNTEIIKRVRRINGDEVELVGDNHNDAHNVTTTSGSIIAVVIGV